MECLLDIRDRAGHVEYGAIGMRSRHNQAVRFREIDERLVVVFGRAELLRELVGRQILLVIQASWIGDLLKQQVELILVAKGQSYRKVQPLRPGDSLQHAGLRHGLRNVTAQDLSLGRLGGCYRQKNDYS